MAKLKKIEFSIGSFFSQNIMVCIYDSGGILRAKTHNSLPERVYSPDIECPGDTLGTYIDDKAREAWLRDFQALQVESWKDRYDNPGICDGTQWSLTCEWEDGTRKEIYGDNAYPETWATFLGLIGMFEPSVIDDDEEEVEGEEMGDQNKFMYVSVVFGDGDKPYNYISDDRSLRIGDRCVVPVGSENSEAIVKVIGIEYYTEDDAPYPPNRTKHIIRKYVDNNGMEEDFYDSVTEALKDMQSLIDEEDWEGLLYWGEEHHEDTRPGIGSKVLEAYERCQQEMSDDNGDIALNIGSLYYNGLVIPQDYTKAVKYYTQSAEAGNLRAIGNLGYCYYYGRSIPQDYDKAYEYFDLGALLGNDPNCLYKLGDMYLSGYHVEKNEGYAFMLYKRAYDANDDDYDQFFKPDICFRLGKCYMKGIGTDINYDKAHRYLSWALDGFYYRRKTDTFIGHLIDSCEKLLRELEKDMKTEIAGNRY